MATWCEETAHWKRPWYCERLKAKGRGQQRMILLDGITQSMDMNLSKSWEIVEDKEALRAAIHEVANSRTWLSDCTTITNTKWNATPKSMVIISIDKLVLVLSSFHLYIHSCIQWMMNSFSFSISPSNGVFRVDFP